MHLCNTAFGGKAEISFGRKKPQNDYKIVSTYSGANCVIYRESHLQEIRRETQVLLWVSMILL